MRIFPSILANVIGEAIHSLSTSFPSDEEASESEIQSYDDLSILLPSTQRPPGRQNSPIAKKCIF